MNLSLSEATLKRFWPHATDAVIAGTVAAWPQVSAHYSFNSALRCAHFWGQISWECNGGTELRENLDYTALRLVDVFGGGHARVTLAEAESIAHNPEAIGERVYGLGNPVMAKELGNVKQGDGFNFRGAGALNTTGREAFDRMGRAIGQNLVDNPEAANDPAISLWMGAAEYAELGCIAFADGDKTTLETRRINGGLNGLQGRIDLIAKWKSVFDA